MIDDADCYRYSYKNGLEMEKKKRLKSIMTHWQEMHLNVFYYNDSLVNVEVSHEKT